MSTKLARPETRPASLRVVLTLVAIFVVAQIVVPLLLLPGPMRQFGWQMYAGLPRHRYEIVHRGGSVEPVDFDRYVLRQRSDVDYRPHLPGFLCGSVPTAIEIRTIALATGEEGSHRCSV